MSKKLTTIASLDVTSFAGGRVRGRCLQFTPIYSAGYAQLTKAEVKKLVLILQEWLGESDIKKTAVNCQFCHTFLEPIKHVYSSIHERDFWLCKPCRDKLEEAGLLE